MKESPIKTIQTYNFLIIHTMDCSDNLPTGYDYYELGYEDDGDVDLNEYCEARGVIRDPYIYYEKY